MGPPSALPRYRRLSDYMSGLFRPSGRSARFLWLAAGGCEWFSNSSTSAGYQRRGSLERERNSLNFQARIHGDSKLDLAIVWDLGISILHTPVVCGPFRARASALRLVAPQACHSTSSRTALMAWCSVRFDQACGGGASQRATTTTWDSNNCPSPSAFNGQRGAALLRGLLKFSLGGSCRSWRTWGVASAFLQPRFQQTGSGAQLAGNPGWSLSGTMRPPRASSGTTP